MQKSTFAGRAAAAALLGAIACCAACGTTQPVADASPVLRVVGSAVSAPAVSAPAVAGCPVRRAWADEVTAAGRVAWQVPLPTDPGTAGIAVQPLADGGEGVFAEENAVYAIRLRDGRQLWRRAFSTQVTALTGTVFGMWPGAPGTVVVLTGQVSDDARLIELRLATGTVGWSLPVPGRGLLGTQALAANRTLAILRPNGDLESVDLVTGRVLWTRAVGTSDGPAAAGTVIAAGAGGRARGYADRSGELLWTASGLPPATTLTSADGLLLAGSGLAEGGITALSPATGRVTWTFSPGEPVTILGAGSAGVALATYVPKRRVYLVNPATGKVRWSVAAFATAEDDFPGQLVETGSSVVLPEAAPGTPPGAISVVARSAASGRVRWSMPAGGAGGAAAGLNLALLPLAGGPAVAVTMARGSGGALSGRLTVRRLATGRSLASAALPAVVSAPLTAAGGGVLAQPDSLSCLVAAVKVAAIG